MNSAKRNYVINELLAKKSAPPTTNQDAGKIAPRKDFKDTRFKPMKRGKHEVGVGYLHRKGFKK